MKKNHSRKRNVRTKRSRHISWPALLVVVVVLAIVCGAVCFVASRFKADPPRRSVVGVDVSHHNGKIDWKKMAASGEVDFVFVKVTEGAGGVGSVDHLGASNIKQARRFGLNVGAYHFLSTTSSAADQFNNFKSHCPSEVNLIPVLDFEQTGNKTPSELRALVLEFISLAEKEYGVKPIIYTSSSLYNNVLRKSSSDFKDNILFIASYSRKPVLADGRSAFIWQYTEFGTAPGAPRWLDKNELVGLRLEDLLLDKTSLLPCSGIEVSHHQGNIDWKQVARDSRIKFAYIKATEGQGWVDPHFAQNLSAARKAGIKTGAYHLYKFSDSPREQFEAFAAACPKESLDLIPMVQVADCGGLGTRRVKRSLMRFVALCRRHYGVAPMICASNTTYNNFLAPEFNVFKLYIARYNMGKLSPSIKGPGHYNIWQNTEQGHVRGISKDVNLCVLHPDNSLDDFLLR